VLLILSRLAGRSQQRRHHFHRFQNEGMLLFRLAGRFQQRRRHFHRFPN
jgi:hypothetical protein